MRPRKALITLAAAAAAVSAFGGGDHPAVASRAADVVRPQLEIAATSSTTSIAGLYPDDIASAYGLSGGVSGATVAVVVAYHDPNLQSDLATYRGEFGLPACTTSNGCLTVVNEYGGSTSPGTNTGWATEESLDVDAVSAACPNCDLLVVEANSAGLSDAGRAENTAVGLGAAAVSNSYGAAENSTWQTYSGSYFTHPGVPMLAAAGDGGDAHALMPAVMPNVIAVGGTALKPVDSTQLHVDGVTLPLGPVVRPLTLLSDAKRKVATLTGRLGTAKKALTAATSALRKAERARSSCTRSRCAAARALVTTRTRQQAAAAKSVRSLTKALAAAKQLVIDLEGLDSGADGGDSSGSSGGSSSGSSSGSSDGSSGGSTSGSGSGSSDGSTSGSGSGTETSSGAGTTTAAFAGWNETVWTTGETGCSAYVPLPSWQSASTGCSNRAVADVAADADPSTGLAVYDSYGQSGWIEVGGTSLATPLVTAMLVRSGKASDYSSASPLYSRTSSFRDIVSGASGTCWIAAGCAAGTGVDLPTGVGAPSSLASF